MNVLTKTKWLWTAKAEKYAKENGLEERTEGVPAWLGDRELGESAPKKWLELGYIKEDTME
jgi:hypothetical protein